MSNLDKQHKVLITGASSGIGATYADRLAKRGHDLLLVARDELRLEELAERLRAENGVDVAILKADLTQRGDLAAVEARLRSDESIGMLVNNAGVAAAGPLLGADIDKLEAMIQLNVSAVTRLAVAAADSFAARGRGVIINVASVLALAPELFNGSYSGTKAYVLNLSQALNGELQGKGVQVQALLPGATRTEIWKRASIDLSTFPAEIVMSVEEMVDAALAGLDQGELVTIPSLPDPADWHALSAARQKLGPNLSRNQAAARYK